jgi:hypothetical protein
MSILITLMIIIAVVLAAIWIIVPNARRETIGVAVVLIGLALLIGRLAP